MARKVFLWLPYLSDIKISNKHVEFNYKGGSENIEWTKIHSIMIYGESCPLPHDFLDKCAFYKIPVVIHRRNVPRAVYISPSYTGDKQDLLTKQIEFRNNVKKSSYITKRLLQAKFTSMDWLIPYDRNLLYRKINKADMLEVEAWHARKYWKKYYEELGLGEFNRRDKNNNASAVLDAVSKFISGIALRWIVYHNLSPYHGFMHTPTDYPSLVYDIMEPYRGYFDKVVFNVLKNNQNRNKSDLTSYAIEEIKKFLDKQVYAGATRQIVTMQELLHGVVLALRVYLTGEGKRFIVPMPTKPNGGRPIKSGYLLYGHKAGITNFWPQTEKITQSFEKLLKN